MAFDPVSYLLSLEPFGIKFGLENISTIVEALEHPERAFRSVHVAGTNGKGSVTAMVEAALCAAGHRAARYTSPHLVHISERFVLCGEPIDSRTLHAVITDVAKVVDDLRSTGALLVQPTFFEVTTAVAFEGFRRCGVQLAVFEVGLGGRLDATNVLVPEVTAITSIGVDHEQYLGSTFREIAGEKAGIIRPAVPVVIGQLRAEAHAVIERIANERNAPVIRALDGTTRGPATTGRDGRTTFQLRTPVRDYGSISLALAGSYQVENAVLAVRILEALEGRGIQVGREAVVAGLAGVRWPGRLDLRRLPDGREVLLDAAHNADGAASLAAELLARPPACPLVFSVMRDKNADEMLRLLVPAVSGLVLTRASSPRSTDPEDLADRARRLAPALPIDVEPVPHEALAAAWRMSRRITVAGSIFLLGDIMNEVGGT